MIVPDIYDLMGRLELAARWTTPNQHGLVGMHLEPREWRLIVKKISKLDQLRALRGAQVAKIEVALAELRTALPPVENNHTPRGKYRSRTFEGV